MARPSKQGLEYFPFDVDFFSDEKITAISWEFGIKGEITAVKLLCAVYRNGYFIEWNEMLKFKLLKELPGISVELLEQIVSRLVRWGLFDKDLFDSASILTSHGIQMRYAAICAKSRRKNPVTDYCLLEDESPAKEETKNNTPRKATPAKTPVESDQTITPSAESYSASFVEEVKRMSQDSVWIEQGICMKYNIDKSEVSELLKRFLAHCISECSEKPHKSYGDAKRHFGNWYRADYPTESKKSKSSIKSNPASASADYSYSGGFGGQDV